MANENLNKSNEISHEINRVNRGVKRLDAQVNIPSSKKIPLKSEGVNGDIRIINSHGRTYLYVKSNNRWQFTLFNDSKILRAIDLIDILTSGIASHDSGWFPISDAGDTNNLDNPQDRGKYIIKHKLNSDLVKTTIFCRFEALIDGAISQHTVDLSSLASHPGPNANRVGFFVDIVDPNTIILNIFPDGLAVLYGEKFKDSDDNELVLLSTLDDTNVGGIEIRVVTERVLSDNLKTPKENKYSSNAFTNLLRSSSDTRAITGKSVSGAKGALVHGTKNGSFKIDSDGTGVLLKNDAGVLKVRNIDDDNDADISLKDLTVGTFTGNQTAIFNAGLSAKNGATGPGYIEFFEDSDNGTNKCTLTGQSSILDYTVTLPPGAGTIRTVETTPLVINYPFWFDDTTTGRTYFRDADDPDDIMSWVGFDTADSTSVDATATIVTANAVSGVVVPYACTYVGAYFLGYQSSATAGEGVFQTWTGVPGDGTGSASTTVTLRTTNAISANRSSESFATSDVSISLAAGSMVYPAFQYVSGTSPKWMGNIALKFENITV